MKFHNPLAIDDEFYLHGVKFFVHDIHAPNIYYYREDGDKKIREMKYIDLISDPSLKGPELVMKKSINVESKEIKKVTYMVDTLLPERREKTELKLKLIKPILLYDKAKQGDLYALHSFKEHYKEFLNPNESVVDLTKNELFERISKNSRETSGRKISTRQLQRYVKKLL